MGEDSEKHALARKQATFARLDALNSLEENVIDDGYGASLRAASGFARRYEVAMLQGISSQRVCDASIVHKTRARRAKSISMITKHVAGPAPGPSDAKRAPTRSETMPAQAAAKSVEKEVTIMEDTPMQPRGKDPTQSSIADRIAALLRKPKEPAKPTIDKITTRKRKRDVVPTVPLNQQVFNGLVMLFVPNNSIAPARRMRIEKAKQYGAVHATELSESVTHVVVDKDLSFKDVLKDLKVDDVPVDVIVVNESYTADCVARRNLGDHNQIWYQVPGREPLKPALEIVASQPSDRSLQLKPTKGVDVTSEPRTPSRTDESSVRILSAEGRPTSELSKADEEQKSVVLADDPLLEIIEEARAAPKVPPDIYDGDDSRPGSLHRTHSNDPSSDSDGELPIYPKPIAKKQRGYTNARGWQQTFQCMQEHNEKDMDNPNEKTIAVLQETENYYYSIRDEWRTGAYRKAIAILRKQPRKIITKEAASSLPGIGVRLAAKIEEIVFTNSLQRLENAKLEPTDESLHLFLQIYGVGFHQASRWVQEGHRILPDLLASPSVKLTPNQQVGIAHYSDFRLRIPRAEALPLAEIVRRPLQKIDPAFEVIIGGSYRRCAPDSGDIDLLVTKKDVGAEYLRHVTLKQLVPFLERIGFLTARLAVTAKDEGSKWHGACQLPLPCHTLSVDHPNDPATNSNPWRRIDLLLVPWDELGAAMVYFTGNDIFNRSMRLLARKKGMRLNQRGLYRDVLTKGAKELTEGQKISGWDEREVFQLLGVPWREATERNI